MGLISTYALDGQFTGKAFAAAHAVITRLTRPFSTVECGLDEADYQRLRDWISADPVITKLDYAFAEFGRRLDPAHRHKDEAVVGLVLHLLYAEHTRRHGREHLYWPEIARLPWHRAHHGWFLSDGHPTAAHREILATAADVFGLRQSREEEGSHWFMTGKLQVGFTSNGVAAHLQDWLTNHHTMTKPVKMLLGRGSDPGLKSESFVHLFGLLSRYRSRNVAENILDRELLGSPWVLPDSIAAIKQAALAESTATEGEGAGFEPEFMTPFALVVSEGVAHFSTSIEGLGSIGLPESPLEVSTIDGRYLANVSFDPSQGFTAYPQRIEVSFGDASSPLLFSVRRKGSPQAILSQQLIGWDPAEWVQVFSAQGRRLSSDSPLVNRDVAAGLQLIMPSVCKLKGKFGARHQLDPNWTLYTHVFADEDGDLKVESDGEVIWDLPSASSAMRVIEDVDAYTVQGVDKSSSIRCVVSVVLKPGFELESVWLGREKLALDGNGQPAEVLLSQDQLMNPMLITIRAIHAASGMKGLVRRKIDVAPRSFVWLKSAHGEGMPLNGLYVGNDTSPDLRVGALPDGGSPLLFEGNRFVGVCPRQRFKPSGLRGLGEPLTLWSGLFNETQETHTLAKRCLDQGIIYKCKPSPTAPDLSLEVQLSNRSINVSEVKWYAYTKGPKCVSLECSWVPGTYALNLWAAGEVQSRDLLCVVATFGGMRVGVWHNRIGRDKAFQLFLVAEEAAMEDPRAGAAYAALITATKAPILCECSLPVVRSWLRRSTIDALAGLIVPARSSAEIPFEEDTARRSSWLDAVGLCYEGSERRSCRTLSDEDAHAIWKALMPDAAPGNLKERFTDVFKIVNKLASISPLLAKDVVTRYLTHANTGTDFAQWRTELRQKLGVSGSDYDNLGKIAGSNVDSMFFSQNLRADATGGDLTKRNQQVLFGLGERLPFNVPKQYYLSRIL
jgi:hypothetical protein